MLAILHLYGQPPCITRPLQQIRSSPHLRCGLIVTVFRRCLAQRFKFSIDEERNKSSKTASLSCTRISFMTIGAFHRERQGSCASMSSRLCESETASCRTTGSLLRIGSSKDVLPVDSPIVRRKYSAAL